MKILLIFLVLATTNGYIYERPKYFYRTKRSYYGDVGGGIGQYEYNNLDLAGSSGPSFKIGLDVLRSLLAVPPSPVASPAPPAPPALPAPPAPPEPMENGGGGGGAQGPPPGQTATVQLPAFVPINLSAMYSAGPAAAPPAPPAPEPPAPEPPAPAAPAPPATPAPPAPEPPAPAPPAPPSEIIRNIITTFEIRKPIPIQVPIPKPIFIPRPVPIIPAPLPPPISTYYTVRGPIYKHHGSWR